MPVSVLVVDDNEVVRDFICQALSRSGVCTCAVESGQDAIETLRKWPNAFSVALIDIVMPGLSGPESMLQIFRINPLLPVVLMTGYTGRFSVTDLIKLGAVDVLQKPFSAAELEAAISRHESLQGSAWEETTPVTTS